MDELNIPVSQTGLVNIGQCYEQVAEWLAEARAEAGVYA